MEKLIHEYSQGYPMLREATNRLPEEELRYKPGPTKWSIHQILIHVADSELVSTQRLKKVLAENEPLLMSVDQNAWASILRYEQLDREQHLFLFKMLRSSMLPILEQLTSQQWERIGVYADAGHFTFKQLLEYRVEHVRGHIRQIERVKENYIQRL